MLSIRLPAEQDTYGALNLYATKPDAFDLESHAVAGILAAHGAVAFSAVMDRQKTIDLAPSDRRARCHRPGQGILMYKHRITGEQAFDLLRIASQRLNQCLRDVAARVTESGSDPGELQ
jgi:hypothetical protein